MRKFLLLFGAFGLVLVLAQTFPALNGVVATDSRLIDVDAVNGAAQGLQAKGAEVLILFIEGDLGSSLVEAEDYLDRALEFYRLKDSTVNGYDPNLFTIFIGTTPLANDNGQRPLYLVYGDNFSSVLEASQAGGTFVDYVQGSVMIPQLLNGEFTSAITAALTEVAAQIANDGAVTQTPEASPEAVPAVSPNPSPTVVEPASRLNGTVWLLTAIFAVLFLIYLVRRVRQPVTSSVDARLKVLKGKLSEQIVDLAGSEARSGHDPFLPADPNAQTDMVLLTGLLQDERPAELATLQSEYRAASESLEKTSKTFEALRLEEEGLSRRSPELETYIERYEALLTDLQSITAFTERLSGQWQALQNLVANVPERLKKLRAALEGIKTGVRNQFVGQPITFKPLFTDLEVRLETAVSSFQSDKGLRALREVEGLEADLAALTSAIERLTTLEQSVDRFTQQLDDWRMQGAPRDFAQKRLNEVDEQVAIGLRLLEQGDFKVVDAQLDEAEERLTEAKESAERQMALLEDNARRLDELEGLGEETKSNIERSALSFDLVDDFAPANWRDIRGNGSEAQKAAAAAFAFWQQAQGYNNLDHPAGVNQAAQALDAAEAELKRAHTLTDAIETRLENLRAAQATAQAQLDNVIQDIATHRDTLRQPEVKRDVGEAPGEQLTQAEALVAEVRSLLAADRPDWLTALANIQEADRLADLALATIKEEREAMAQRRRMLESEKTEAETSVKRIVQFVRTRKPDLQVENLAKVQQAVDTFRHAKEVEANAKNLSGEALSTTLKEATIIFDEAQRLADDTFVLLEKDFQTAETLRQETAEAVAQAHASFLNLERFVRSSGLTTSMNASLSALANDLPHFDAGLGPERLQKMLTQATRLEREIEQLYIEARRHAEVVQSAQRQERLRQLEMARRRRAAQDARQRSTWGSWPEAGVPVRTVPTRPRTSVRSAPRPMPRAPSAPPLKLPKRSKPSGNRSGGGWGGGGRKSGRGW